jgi:hypothetical protein
MPEIDYMLHPIGFIRSSLKDRADAPRQGSEGAPDAWIEVTPALEGFRERGMRRILFSVSMRYTSRFCDSPSPIVCKLDMSKTLSRKPDRFLSGQCFWLRDC